MSDGASSSVFVIAREAILVASPSFVTDLNCDGDGQIDLKVMTQHGLLNDTGGLAEFQVSQQFQDKEEVVLIMKAYRIRHGVEYRVLESDHVKYHKKCKEFGNGCTWLI
ncbi:hypothetical protein Ahy_A08g039602 [Arachis hypogaea]|uniref:Transposase MuDR plant domain-containing protein n=1 Tax=Arachis hypogaea TaxID=3818 RepID=A0A445BWR3_ARAHY|nr:hypothetical protein Ahy_A08g039602 [Arachis hypogaea]